MKNSVGLFPEEILKFVIIFVALVRVRISFMISLAALSGYFLLAAPLNQKPLFLFLGILCTASGASALNQLQEWNVDCTFERTRERPIPSGKLSRQRALTISLILFSSGELLLFLTGKPELPLCALLAILIYNGLYTPLKKITPQAYLVGSFVCALMPVMGGILAHSSLRLEHFLLALFFYLWQIPHYWIISLSHEKDIRNNILPNIFCSLSRSQVRRITSLWLLFLASLMLFFPYLGITREPIIILLIIVLSGVLSLVAIAFILKEEQEFQSSVRKTGVYLNGIVLLVIILLCVNGITG